MFIAILQHTPLWVWALLCTLVALGLAQTRAREVSLLRITAVPLLLMALSLGGMFSAFGSSGIALCGWAAGLCMALAFARGAVKVRGATWSPASRLLQVPGSWLPLALMIGLFTIKYFAGASLAMNQALAGDAIFSGLCSLAYGSVNGLFLARSWSLRALTTRQPRVQAA